MNMCEKPTHVIHRIMSKTFSKALTKLLFPRRFWRTENSLLTGQQSGLLIQRRFPRKRESMVKTRTRREIKWIPTVTVIQKTRLGKAATFWALNWSSSRKLISYAHFFSRKQRNNSGKSVDSLSKPFQMWQLVCFSDNRVHFLKYQ